MKKSESPIILEYQYNSTIEQVWNALTVHKEMIQWYFENIPDFKAETGFETSFIVQSDTRKFNHLWKVTEAVVYKKLTYSWKYSEYSGDSFVSFEIDEKEGAVKLKLTVTITENFSDEIPEFKKESCIGGWNYFLGGNLSNYLENK